ncbi:hypothetical protein HK099_005994 [Clydaea vesicula]|uniref:Uncharacterized protein n=1 Tax=Clydaea vesicula TaxID=447962 RepID=A0AAD5U0T9_9FUNG|nr:hypothetical protein HK099_005994 [Clydaea vesicula]
MDFDKIVEVVRIGINEYNKVNNNPLGYNETITVFYLKLIEKNLKSLLAVTDTRFISLHDIEFEDFLKTFPEILDKNLIFQFYSSKNLIEKLKYVPPDLKEI